MRSPLVRSGATIALGAAALVTLVAASPADMRVDGYQITMKMTAEMPAGEMPAGTPAGPVQMDVVIKSTTDQLRVEMDFSKLASGGGGDMAAAGAMMAGMYMLLRSDGKMVTVMPSMGMAMIADPSAILGGGGGLAGMGISTKVDTAAGWLKITDLGAGERIAGYATRKFRAEVKYKETVTVMGTTTADSTESVYDLWVTTDASDALGALRKYSEKFGGSVGSGNKEIFDAWTKKLPANSVPLRTVGHMTTAKGKTSMTLEVAEIKKATFEATDFDVPAGMQVMDMSAMMGGRGRGGR